MITRNVAPALALVLLTASVASGAAAGPCDSVTYNDWTWFIGGKVNFAPSGHTRFTGSGAIPAASGKWTCSADGTIRITWENGFVDTVRMSADALQLKGSSSTGSQVSAVRAGRLPGSGNAAAPAASPTAPAQKATTPDGWTPIGDGGFGKQSTVPIGPKGPQPIGPQGRPPPKGAG